ncbi:non-canonical purine NTP pyrophosphatase [Cystobacter fuscus]
MDALGGKPGVLSARYAENAEARLARLLADLRGVPPGERWARLVCCLALAFPGSGSVHVTTGELRGEVSHHPRGLPGLEYDRVLLLPHGQTLAELRPAQRRLVSPRAAALRLMEPHLRWAALKLVVWAWARWFYGVAP